MADQKVTELPIKNQSAINVADYLFGIDAAEGYQMLISDLAKKIIEDFTGSTLGGSSQALKTIIDAINTKIGNTAMGTTATTITGAIHEHETDISTLNGNIGSFYDGEESTGIAVPSDGSGTTVINHVTLANAGRYLVIGRAYFTANANGSRTIGLSTDSALKLYQSNTAASAGNINMYMQVVWYTTVTANTTINLIARQISGSSLTVNSRMTAVQLK